MKENTPSCCSLLCPFHRFAVPLPRKRGRALGLRYMHFPRHNEGSSAPIVTLAYSVLNVNAVPSKPSSTVSPPRTSPAMIFFESAVSIL